MKKKLTKEEKMLGEVNADGLTYEQYANKMAEILFFNWNVDVMEVPFFNVYSHFKSNVPIETAVKICMGVADSPWDFLYEEGDSEAEFNSHLPVENEFYDDYVDDLVNDNQLYDWEINALRAQGYDI